MPAQVHQAGQRTPVRIAAGFGISAGTAHAYVTGVVGLLADRAPGLLKALWESDPDFVLLDGTLAECDRSGDGRGDYSAKHRRHGVNVQDVTDPTGKVLGISPALPGGPHRCPPGGELTPTQRTVNRAPAQARAPRRTRHGTAEVRPASAPTA